MNYSLLGKTGLKIPAIVFGTSCLGNLYKAMPDEQKRRSLREFFKYLDPPVVLDSAGKYGAGLALEVIGRGLAELGVPPENVIISNKLAWYRVPLRGSEPTFEPGAWADLKNDAEQRISHDGILECWEQGCHLLGGRYRPQLVSVHDPDEYLAKATDPQDLARRWEDVLGAYRALAGLKQRGEVKAIGVGSKDWKIIRTLVEKVDLDWVMLACSLTIMQHPPELLAFIGELHRCGIGIVNSAVFHAGFLTGGEFFDYRRTDPANSADRPLFAWRETFFRLCREHDVSPAAACVRFGLTPPGVLSIALNTGNPDRIRENVELVQTAIPDGFWQAMKTAGLIARDYPYAG